MDRLRLPSEKSVKNNGKPLIVDPHETDEAWNVYPTPGFCIKFREPELCNKALIGADRPSDKFFINLAHCMELPSPAHDVDEDEAARLIDFAAASGSGNSDGFRIPISIGELEWAEDKKGEAVQKVDALVNSNFFRKRLDKSEFFRQFTLNIIVQAIAQRHGIRLDMQKQVFLQNRKHIGELHKQRIRKRPAAQFSGENNPKEMISCFKNAQDSLKAANNDDDSEVIDIDTIEENTPKKPRNFRVQILGGEMADIKIRVRDPNANDALVHDLNRLTLKMNDDRCVLLLDSQRTVADFFSPFALNVEKVETAFERETATLHIRCPVDWKLPVASAKAADSS